MSYLVLARKWRPQTFDDLVGQEHVSRTLGNAIAQGRVAHAFLFTGVRGVGKTTSARILAKALNCVNGPTAAPCLECSACKEIAAGVDVDVQEIDAASHTGVDDVRRIQESLPYRPARDRFKILIVDEVHMLSANAWNAFLKTLEEPPPHVKFIFATTEVHKVPITILSRCQRFDFKMIAAAQIAARVRHILSVEKIAADEAAIQLVAREAAGSMRDALSILDQVIAFGGDSLEGDEVAKVLGVADRAALHGLAGAIVEGRAADALRMIEALAAGGFDLVHVARDLLRRCRDLVVARVVPEPEPLLDLADAELADVKALAAAADPDDLTRIFQGMSRGLDEIAKTGNPRHALEMAAVRLARRPPMVPVDALLERLADLERRVGGGGGPRAPGGGGGGGARAPGGGGGGGPARAQGGFGAAPASTASATAAAPRSAAPPPTVATAPRTYDAPAGISAARAVQPASNAPPANVTTVTGPLVQPEGLLAPSVVERARAVAARLREERQTWGSLVEHAIILRCDADAFELAYEKRSFFAAQLADGAVIEAITRAAKAELGSAARIMVCDGKLSGRTLAQLANEQRTAALDAARREAVAHPVVQEAIAIFKAEVKTVKLPGDE
ncbi:MAG: DNA polymerase III subunit gamma/tau [Deltaproteobacteria bacterium]|nr:DNA polymerase III subunit gamma/tau [Deltaproteobacteria bacterium]